MASYADYFFNVTVHRGQSSKKYKIEDLEKNTEIRFIHNYVKKFGTTPKFLNYCSIKETDLRKFNILQIVDILAGAVAAKKNKKISSAGKRELIEYIETKLGRSLDKPPSKPFDKHYNLWEFRPNK
jgi:hypothetical protein